MNSHLIKPIETSYKGYRFRSRLEARWAILFDGLGFKWGYEIEGFKLPSGAQYLPDFYLYDFGVWFEVKGSYETTSDSDREKIYEFSGCGLGQNIIVATGQIGEECLMFYGNYGVYQVWFSPNPFNEGLQISVMREDSIASYRSKIYQKIDDVYQQARSARFEFGEQK